MMNKIINYRELIDRSTQDFVGRRWVREAVDAFLAAAGPAAFLLLGEPGSGKTAFMADLARERGCAARHSPPPNVAGGAERWQRRAGASRTRHSDQCPRRWARPACPGRGPLWPA
jgi:hypothetical protein